MTDIEKFDSYFKEINLSDPVIKRIEEIYNFYIKILDEDIEDVFITEYVDQENRVNFENLWFFSKNFCMESKGFLTQDSFDLARMSSLIRLEIKKKKYDFVTLQSDSRLRVDALINERLRLVLTASGKNCEYLKKIIEKYIIAIK